VTSDSDDDGHVASQCDLFGVDLALFSDDDGSRILAASFDVVGSRCLQQVPLSVALLAMTDGEGTLSETGGGRGGNTGPCSSGGGDVMLLAFDKSCRLVADGTRADNSPPPVIKFSSLSTHAS